MGKKKRGNKAKSKKDRKQEIQARRERQLEAPPPAPLEQEAEQRSTHFPEQIESENVWGWLLYV